jgi:hypothetical protein
MRWNLGSGGGAGFFATCGCLVGEGLLARLLGRGRLRPPLVRIEWPFTSTTTDRTCPVRRVGRADSSGFDNNRRKSVLAQRSEERGADFACSRIEQCYISIAVSTPGMFNASGGFNAKENVPRGQACPYIHVWLYFECEKGQPPRGDRYITRVRGSDVGRGVVPRPSEFASLRTQNWLLLS